MKLSDMKKQGYVDARVLSIRLSGKDQLEMYDVLSKHLGYDSASGLALAILKKGLEEL